MSQKTIRTVITVLTLFTAMVHLFFLNFRDFDKIFTIGNLHNLFLLNGIAYLVLLGCLLARFPGGMQRLLHYAFMAFAAVTIVAWFVVNKGDFSSILGVSTKIVELALIAFLWLDLKHVSA